MGFLHQYLQNIDEYSNIPITYFVFKQLTMLCTNMSYVA